ncbi:helix-turn-helix domain-containing protein [Streptomyces sp. SCSIO ZS0520]|uniref:helix-turn-helix domain-containing protein n=1 Tax=Streptomyces sp. SCSIO ZS0520 TaxID=2892996 RepID=UPI0021D8F27A|nr:helix-turn-helix domain-containing protein [Streptomyces sp. SCSIO ZS0520]
MVSPDGIGQLLRGLREGAGRTRKQQAELLEGIGGRWVDPENIKRWETERRVPVPHWHRLIADGYGLTIGEVQRAVASSRTFRKLVPAPTSSEPEQEVPPVERRDFLGVSVLAAGLTGPALAWISDTRERVDHALSSGARADLPHLESAVEHYSHGYGGRTPAAVLKELGSDFADIGPLFEQPLSAGSRVRLSRVAGQLAGMIAIVLHDVGDRKESSAWFRTARLAAVESGDRSLQAWALAREAMVPLNFGAPRTAAELAEKARQTAGTAPTATAALAAAVAARAHALCGRRDQARQAIADANRFAGQLTGEQRADTWFGLGEQKQHVHLSHALTVLGETGRARESQDRALALSSPTSAMTRTLLRIDGAACLHREGDSEQACRTAAAALRGLPPGFRIGLTRARAMDLYRSIPTRHHAEPAVRELRETLAA